MQQALLDVLHDTDPIQVHGYSMAGGFDGTRRAVAEDLTHRFGMTIRPEELFFTCGAAAALISVIRALTVSPDSEFVAIAPYFPEYLPLWNPTAASWCPSPPIWTPSRSLWTF